MFVPVGISVRMSSDFGLLSLPMELLVKIVQYLEDPLWIIRLAVIQIRIHPLIRIKKIFSLSLKSKFKLFYLIFVFIFKMLVQTGKNIQGRGK